LECRTVARRFETAHVADSQRSSDSLFKNKRSRRIAKGDGLAFFCMQSTPRPEEIDADGRSSLPGDEALTNSN
jgi:hypothetical protein